MTAETRLEAPTYGSEFNALTTTPPRLYKVTLGSRAKEKNKEERGWGAEYCFAVSRLALHAAQTIACGGVEQKFPTVRLGNIFIFILQTTNKANDTRFNIIQQLLTNKC